MEPRIGDAERETATARLGDHFAAGRLDHEEYDERLDAIWSARTRADLDQLFWDLPRIPAQAAPPPAPAARRRPPLLPIAVIAVLIGVAAVEAAPWLLVVGIVWLVFLRPRRHDLHGSRSHARSCR